LIQSIEQPCIVFFDEFEKVYDREDQERLLTLLDGIFTSKKLFMLTSNDKWRVDDHMRNRPGRIFYMVEFKGLDENFIREYCNDNLANKAHIDSIVNIASVFASFNFDMLKAVVEEMNRYNETPQEAMRILNVRTEFDGGTAYSVEVWRGDRKANKVSPSVWVGSPLSSQREIDISYWFKNKSAKLLNETKAISIADDDVEDDSGNGWFEKSFNNNDMVKYNANAGQFIFEKDDITVILSKEVPKYFNFDAF
jgi:SpoVK/Ycf46/Vps4 family AAA+-type ATPase